MSASDQRQALRATSGAGGMAAAEVASRHRLSRAVAVTAGGLGTAASALTAAWMVMVAALVAAWGVSVPTWPGWLWPVAALCATAGVVMLLWGTIRAVRGQTRSGLLIAGAALWSAAAALVVPTIAAWWPAVLIPPVLTLTCVLISTAHTGGSYVWAQLRENHVTRWALLSQPTFAERARVRQR